MLGTVYKEANSRRQLTRLLKSSCSIMWSSPQSQRVSTLCEVRLDPGVAVSTNLTNEWTMLSKELKVAVVGLTGTWQVCSIATPEARKKWKPQILELSLMSSHVLEEWTHWVRFHTSTKAAKLLQDLVEAEKDAGAAIFPTRWSLELLRCAPPLVGGVGLPRVPKEWRD